MTPHDLQQHARDAIRQSHRAQRKARLTLADLEHAGPPVRLKDLADLTGFSKQKFYQDIQRGILPAAQVQTGQTTVYAVERGEALGYLRAIKFAA